MIVRRRHHESSERNCRRRDANAPSPKSNAIGSGRGRDRHHRADDDLLRARDDPARMAASRAAPFAPRTRCSRTSSWGFGSRAGTSRAGLARGLPRGIRVFTGRPFRVATILSQARRLSCAGVERCWGLLEGGASLQGAASRARPVWCARARSRPRGAAARCHSAELGATRPSALRQ